KVFYGSWKCSSTVLISEGDAVSDGVRTRHKGKHLWCLRPTFLLRHPILLEQEACKTFEGWIMINGRG
ncbi:Os04g0228300, partial [Oryza sativa Japonica Group]